MLRYALRNLRRSPVFTTVAILSLALGIGANTAIFSLLDQVLLRTLPVKNPGELVTLAPVRGAFHGSSRCDGTCLSLSLLSRSARPKPGVHRHPGTLAAGSEFFKRRSY